MASGRRALSRSTRGAGRAVLLWRSGPGRVNDLSSLALIFPPKQVGEPVKVIWRHWCPDDDILRRSRRDEPLTRLWRDQGWLVATEGNTTDFRSSRRRSWRWRSASTSWKWPTTGLSLANWCATSRMKASAMVEFGQAHRMGPAAAEFMRLLIGRQLLHGGNPNCHLVCVQRRGAPRSCRQRKRTRSGRPNGSMRCCRDHGVAGRRAGGAAGSVYEERGLLVI